MTITHDTRPSGGESAGADVAPWDEWLAESTEAALADPSSETWLDRLAAELPVHAITCRDDESQLASAWEHMLPALSAFKPSEVDDLMSQRIAAAARRGAAEALLELVRVERARVSAEQEVELETEFSGVRALRRLLDGIQLERVALTRKATGELLEMLCALALDLETTERTASDGAPGVHDALTEMRAHIVNSAAALRTLPANIDPPDNVDGSLTGALHQVVARYSGRIDVDVTWNGDDIMSVESATAFLWVVEELLNQARHAQTAQVFLEVSVDHAVTFTVTTPSQAYALDDIEPQWLLRSQLRLQLAGGDLSVLTGDAGTGVEAALPL